MAITVRKRWLAFWGAIISLVTSFFTNYIGGEVKGDANIDFVQRMNDE